MLDGCDRRAKKVVWRRVERLREPGELGVLRRTLAILDFIHGID